MSLVRFCSRAILLRNNRVNCISAVVGRNPVQVSWLATATGSDQHQRRDYHSTPPPASKNGGSQQKQQRGMSSAQTSTAGAIGQRDPLDTGFCDPVAAFKSKTLIELIRAYAVYMICSSAYLVENNMKVRAHILSYVIVSLSLFGYLYVY